MSNLAKDKIIAICEEMKWSYWTDSEGKLYIDVEGSLKCRELITSEVYKEYLKKVNPYFTKQPKVGSEEGDDFIRMCNAILQYEETYYPISSEKE